MNWSACRGVDRREVRPFTDKQIELVQNFAAQAVIAIENVRVLNELRPRTNDLTESLEQQTATSEVLEVISSSPGELELVFRAMLDSAVRICEARFGNLYMREADGFRAAVMHNAPPGYAETRAGVVHPVIIRHSGKQRRQSSQHKSLTSHNCQGTRKAIVTSSRPLRWAVSVACSACPCSMGTT